jgi:hypothetical protein
LALIGFVWISVLKPMAHAVSLWSLLYMLGSAPDLDVAFEEEADREAARNLMDALAASGGA